MLAAERDQAIIGAKGYASYIDGLRSRGKDQIVKHAHRWLRDRMWPGYVQTGKTVEAVAQRFNAAENSDEWVAWTVFYRACGLTSIPSFLIRNGIANLPAQWPPVGREYIHSIHQKWVNVIEGSGQYSAWKRRLHEQPNTTIGLSTIMHEGRMVRGLELPAEWPPNRDGSIRAPPEPAPSPQRRGRRGTR